MNTALLTFRVFERSPPFLLPHGIQNRFGILPGNFYSEVVTVRLAV